MSAVLRFFTVVVALAIAGCGGGDLQTGVGSGGSGAPVSGAPLSIGTVTGFGSIIVNGEHFDESGATVLIDERPERPTQASVAALRLGTRVELEHRDRRITTATVGSALIGPVTSVSGSGFMALGQTVRVDATPARPTVFDGFTSLIDLATGAVVEVHGERASSGEIFATRVQLRQADLNVVRLVGTATNVSGRSFTIGALAVNATDATILPAATSLSNGDRVAVWTDVPYGGGVLAAKIVRIGGIQIADNAPLTLEGPIEAHQSASAFRVGGVRVDAGSAAFVGGTAADLENGRPVRVRGAYANGVLSATTVEFLQPVQVTASLTGPMTDFVDAGNLFRIRDAQARVTPQTTYVGGGAANLGTGVSVRLEGPVINGTVEATTLEFLAVPADAQRVVLGAVATAPSAAAADGSRTFRIDGLTEEVRTTAGTTYRNGASADVAIGRQLRVRGTMQGSLLVADEVEFMDSPANPPTIDIEGIASKVRTDSVTVNGQEVRLTASTTYTLDGTATTRASLVDGARVEIIATRVAGILTAQSVEIAPADGGWTSVRGLVSGRASPDATTFMVGTQRVSASAAAQIVPGNLTLADVVNGSYVEVQGTIAGGVLTATRIKFR
jgi:hypothetical protein